MGDNRPEYLKDLPIWKKPTKDKTRKMTKAERKKYGESTGIKQSQVRAFVIKDVDVERNLENRGLKRKIKGEIE